MLTNEMSVRLDDGFEFVIGRIMGAESGAEFSGRALCEIEDKIRQRRKIERAAPIPKGTRWTEWHNHGHKLRRFNEAGMRLDREHTGELYTDRTVLVHG